MNRVSRIVLWSVLLSGCDDGEQGRAGQDVKNVPVVSATRVEVAVISPSSFSIQLSRPGEVEAGREANLAAALGGQIEQVNIEIGDHVRSGQVLATVDKRLRDAEKALAEVEVADAKRELKRLESMGTTIASVRVDEAKTSVERKNVRLRIAKIQAKKASIRAPFAGVISAREMERGEVAAPGMVLVTVVSLDPAIVTVSVTDRDMGSLKTGLLAKIQAVGSSTALDGKIKRIQPTANTKTRSFHVEVEVENHGTALRPGMIANVRFEGEKKQEQIVLPQEFLVTNIDGNGVFVVDDEKIARWRPLTLGQLVRDQVVVESGLAAGDIIVILGHRGLHDGDPVLEVRRGECCVNGRVQFTQIEAGEKG